MMYSSGDRADVRVKKEMGCEGKKKKKVPFGAAEKFCKFCAIDVDQCAHRQVCVSALQSVACTRACGVRASPARGKMQKNVLEPARCLPMVASNTWPDG
ncbi:hypothetical protein ACO2Q9_05865 [Variovorax sp. VNK109]|uniref:hypothetical protein n=1 Tax=Variovorax sp. VNK109 TaxID=3400919 RepID=UPI003BFBD309